MLEDLQPLSAEMDFDSDTASFIRVPSREYAKACKIPDELVAELAQKAALAHNIWVQARKEKDFSKFQPIFGRISHINSPESRVFRIYRAYL